MHEHFNFQNPAGTSGALTLLFSEVGYQGRENQQDDHLTDGSQLSAYHSGISSFELR
jgi:hypothetical protein